MHFGDGKKREKEQGGKGALGGEEEVCERECVFSKANNFTALWETWPVEPPGDYDRHHCFFHLFPARRLGKSQHNSKTSSLASSYSRHKMEAGPERVSSKDTGSASGQPAADSE